MTRKPYNLRTVIFIAILGALSTVLMMLSIPLPFAPTFLKLDIAEFPGLFAGFFFGPGAGAVVIVLKNLLKVLLSGSETMYVGELMNIVGSLGFMLPAALIYRRRKTKKDARMALISAVVVGSIFALALNYFVAFPLFASVYGIPLDAIIGMGSATNPLVNNMFTLLVFGVVPFNLVKLSLTALITWLFYKRTGSLFNKMIESK